MLKYWWLAGILFVACLVVYTVASGWVTRVTINNNVRRATRQIEVEDILADLAKCQKALAVHRHRVFLLSVVLKQPDFTATDTVAYEISNAEQYFQALTAVHVEDITLDARFQTGKQQLKAYRVPSVSVLSASGEMWLEIAVWGLGILTLALGLLRPLSSA